MDTGTLDIFATKGSEYLLVIGYLVVLIGVWRLLREPEPMRAVAGPGRWVGDCLTLPDRYCFHQGHSWAVQQGGNVVRIGMDDFAHRLLGRPTAIELPEVGTYLSQGEPGWEIRVGSRSVGMLSPVEGEVVAVNHAAVSSPEILCSEPYDRGWLLEVRVPDHRRSQKHLLCGNLAEAWMEEKLRAMRFELGLVLPDDCVDVGCEGFARALAPENWDEVVRGLLLSGETAQAVAAPGRRVGGWITLPDEYCFHQGHSWAVPEDGNVAKVGMDDLAHRLLGQPDAIELPELGTRLTQGERAWTISVGSTSVGMLSPVEGEVVAVNHAAVSSPEILCSEPYDGGWLLKVQVSNHRRNQKNLLCGYLAWAWMEEELRTLRASQLAPVFPDGSSEGGCDGFLRAVAPEDREEVAGKLLLSVD